VCIYISGKGLCHLKITNFFLMSYSFKAVALENGRIFSLISCFLHCRQDNSYFTLSSSHSLPQMGGSVLDCNTQNVCHLQYVTLIVIMGFMFITQTTPILKLLLTSMKTTHLSPLSQSVLLLF